MRPQVRGSDNGEDIVHACGMENRRISDRGYIQLAIRSGYYKKMNALAIKEGELKRYDPLNEEIEIDLIQDDVLREQTPTAGYYAMFEYLNGFRKVIYWSKAKMLAHAGRYSAAFSLDESKINVRGQWKTKVSYADFTAGKYAKDDAWMYSSFWYQNFDGMAIKTMLRQLISKWGIMSIEMRQAFEADMSTIQVSTKNNETIFTPDYIDTATAEPNEAPQVDEAQPQPATVEHQTIDFSQI